MVVKGMMPKSGGFTFAEGLLIALAVWSMLIRAMRPFINEIILLERTPLTSRRGSVRLGKRSSSLHGPSGSDLFMRWVGAERNGIVRLEPCGHQVEVAGEWRRSRRCRACEAEAARKERAWIQTGESELARRLRLAMGLAEPSTTEGS